MNTLLIGLLLFAVDHAFAHGMLGCRPTNGPGQYGDVVNCDAQDSNGWAKCWTWSNLNNRWEQSTYYCPTVGCDRKVAPDDYE